MAKSGILGQISEVESLDEQSIDATIYTLGTVQNTNFLVKWEDLTADQKLIANNFRQLIIDLNPEA
jgi:hypothetical protein